MTKEELDIQKEIEKYFTESTGFGKDKIRNFMDVVNKALKQKGERIEKLEAQIEKMKCCENCEFKDCNKSSQYQTCWYCTNKDKWKLGR